MFTAVCLIQVIVINLGRSARAHALDMGDTCGILQHNSCSGVEWDRRIKLSYKTSSFIGENIAVGYSDPFLTMNQWIMDIPQGSNKPAADSSLCTTSTGGSYLCDGHRWNIMNKDYKEIGTGYAYGAFDKVQNHYFWVQDFGGGSPSISNPIVCGVHFLKESGKTTFLVNYWDPSLKAPTEASLYLNGKKNTMTLLMGSAGRGAYQAMVSRGTSCRDYYFSFVDGSGKTWRYPEEGWHTTAGEGGCTVEGGGMVMAGTHPEFIFNTHGITSKSCRCAAVIFVRNGLFFPQSTSLIDSKGKLLERSEWSRPRSLSASGGGAKLHMAFKNNLTRGMYILVHRISDSYRIYEKIMVIE